MRRKFFSVLLCMALIAACVLPAHALDIEDPGILPTELNIGRPLINGSTETTVPEADGDTAITRLAFLMLLGTAANVVPEEQPVEFLRFMFEDVDPSDPAAPYLSWALRNGIVSGTDRTHFSPESVMNRAQIAAVIYRYLNAFHLTLPVEDGTPAIIGYADSLTVPRWAFAAVDYLTRAGLLTGMENRFGGSYFLPNASLSYEEAGNLLLQMDAEITLPEVPPVLPENLVLNVDALELEGGEQCTLLAMVFPLNADVRTILWYSTDPAVSVDANGTVTGMGIGTAEIHALTATGTDVFCTVSCRSDPPVVEQSPAEEEPTAVTAETAVYVPTSYEDKCRMVFGQVLSDPRLAYANGDEAQPHMVCISIQAWDLNADGEKHTRTFYLEVHENVAEIVKALFAEIYELPEQPVIHSVGGYRWDGKCEHSVGLAIDINPMENYYCDPNGNAVVGSYFKPGEDPYSIPVGGAVDQIFAKYGFTRGIYWRSGYKDYMHYSFFGS